MVSVCVLQGLGINADEELITAFAMAGARPNGVHVNDLIREPGRLDDVGILAIPGGFSFGDHLGSGHVLALLLRRRLGSAIDAFRSRGGLILGICNGFQVLVKAGLLPFPDRKQGPAVSLIGNSSGRFEDRWVRVACDPLSPCVWTAGIEGLELPVRHGEGRFVVGDPRMTEQLIGGNLAAMRYIRRTGARGPAPYPDNPNGSAADIAGVCDPSGRVFGLMPHPEAYVRAEHHPRWTRERGKTRLMGLAIITNGVRRAEQDQ